MARRRPPAKFPPPIITQPGELEHLAELASIDDDGRDEFLDELGEVFRNYHQAADQIDRNRHREAAPTLRELVKVTQRFRMLLERYPAAGLLRELHVDVDNRGHAQWLELIVQACREHLQRARRGGRPTQWATKWAIIELARLQGCHCAVLAHREPSSFTGDDPRDRRAEFASELKRTRVTFVQEALKTIRVEAKRAAIRDVIARGVREGSLDTPESFYDQRESLTAAREGARRAHRNRSGSKAAPARP